MCKQKLFSYCVSATRAHVHQHQIRFMLKELQRLHLHLDGTWHDAEENNPSSRQNGGGLAAIGWAAPLTASCVHHLFE